MTDRDNMMWCILRMASNRTLAVAHSLRDAGLEVWTPEEVVVRRRGPSRKRIERTAAMLPTFAFARADQIATLIAAAHAPTSQHPAFHVMRFHDRYPLVNDRSLEPLRRLEASRRKRRALKERQPQLERGTRVRLSEGGFAGMDGIVEGANGAYTMVAFPGWRVPIKIATFLLVSDVADEPCKEHGITAEPALV